ncbi:hypothetical protein HJA85_27060 [Rhizobium bangladeshense]|uniref:hypothetical protein n=1 Tax=Rhizobium bangladeshense TaxID=1138189 RepID=UPI001C82EBAE|nr:hypothetical protein [Rhizobium bangladeshense]MBX4870585.1 hypothetical protein [Rhizobium bangladeshense]
MPNTEFLVRANLPPTSVPNALDDLRDASTLFAYAWSRNDIQQAVRASKNVKQLFDFVINELMRARDDLISGATNPPNPAYLAALRVVAGQMVTPVSRADQEAVVNAGHGNGRLPSGTNIVDATLEQVLNKVKHQVERMQNFRVSGGQHFMVVSADKNREPDCILEFDVVDFCNKCRIAYDLL